MDELLEQFQNPPKTYSPAPLWFWNGKLEKRELSRQIDEMVDKHVFQAFLHPRAYLITPYLEKEWWEAVGYTVEYARQKGFFPWLYDEYAWPSGTAGSTFRYSCQKPSRVLAKGECNMAKGLRFRELNTQGGSVHAFFKDEPRKPVAVSLITMDTNGAFTGEPADITEQYGRTLRLPMNHTYKILAFFQKVYRESVDYLNPAAIRDFLNFTHEEYKKRYGKDFGNLIPGIFFDEIFNIASPIVWTDRFPEEFRQRKGYDILPCLPYLIYQGSTHTCQIRRDYFDVLASLYEKAFFQQIADWCSQNHFQLTGHTEEWIGDHPLRQGNYFKTMRHLHIPGSDCHGYRYRYPRAVALEEPKWAVSVARMYGKERCMSEAMGGSGWGTSLQGFKRGVNTLAAMGISLFIFHGFYYGTDRQGSQGDWPASLFFQNPYWKYFDRFADYVGRVSLINSSGVPVVDTALYYPIAEVQSGFQNGGLTPEADRLSHTFNRILSNLITHQMDIDIIDRDSILRGTAENGRLRVGTESLKILLLPACLEADEPLRNKLKQLSRQGVRLLFYRCGGKEGIAPDSLREKIEEILAPDVKELNGEYADLYTCHRRIKNQDWYFIANASDRKRELSLRFRCAGIPVLFSVETGKPIGTAKYERQGNFTAVSMHLDEDQALYVVFGQKETVPTLPEEDPFSRLTLNNPWQILPLDSLYDSQWNSRADQSILEIPLSKFSSDYQSEPFTIRVCNRKGENGNCGRHLSLWKAAWITRRPGWADDSCRQTLYFRKKIRVAGPVRTAKTCIAAVGKFTLYVNGKKAIEGEGWNPPAETDLREFLGPGENLIAVKVDNTQHIPGANVLEAETLPPEGLTSLLIQGNAEGKDGPVVFDTGSSWISSDRFCDGWQNPAADYENAARSVDPSRKDFRAAGEGEWLHCWERGTPPLLPWGPIPLFGRQVTFPAEVRYEMTLPAGTIEVFSPDVRGTYSAFLNGQPVDWRAGSLHIPPETSHTLLVKIRAYGPEDGLLQPIRVKMAERSGLLGDWCRDGLKWFSGRVSYRRRFSIRKKPGYRYRLDLGQVNFCAEVWINAQLADVRVWKPYQTDITQYLKDGENEICIIAANLAANARRFLLVDEGRALAWNRYWNQDNILRDSENLVSGLLGPVQIECIRTKN